MRAVQVQEFGPFDGLVVSELADPHPGPDEVVIDVAAAGVNFPDVLVVEGTYQTLPARPFSPGKEAAGTVLAVGENVRRLAVGDRVLALVEYGAFTEHLVVAEELVVALPDGIECTEAAAFAMMFSTAHFGLFRRAGLQPGETALITGAGGAVGSAGVQLAKAYGARVIALARDEQRAELATSQGADIALTSDVDNVRGDLLAATDGRGVDVTLDVVGGDVFAQAVRATAWEGRLVIVGFASGDQNPIKPGHLLVKNISVMGLQGSDYRDRTPEITRAVLAEMLELYVQGRIAVPIAGVYPFSKTADALQAVKNGGLRGKVVVVRDGEQLG